MRFPQLPPPTGPIFESVLSQGLEKAQSFWRQSRLVDDKGQYLHWDELRFRTAPDGLSHPEWWTAVRMGRQAASQVLPLLDERGASFTFCEPPALKVAVRYLDMNAGGALRSDSHGLSTGEGRAHLSSSLAEEPFASSLIEGAATTRQIAKQLIFAGRQPQSVDELMVLNNYRAMEFVKQHKDTALSMPFLLQLHQIVTQGTLPDAADAGRVRTNDEVRVVDASNDEVLYQPPPASELDARLALVFAFANQDEGGEAWVHPLVKAMLLHFMIAYEHPFVDGNGRVARAMFYWFALRSGYWLLEYVSISTVIARSKIDYGRSFLFVETDASDTTYFLENQAQTLVSALESLHAYVEKKRAEIRALEARLTDWTRADAFNHRQVNVLNSFLKELYPQIAIADHQSRHGVSYLTARSDLEKLVVEGYAQKSKRGQVSIYRPAPDLADRLKAA